jgi:hypothetical protein
MDKLEKIIVETYGCSLDKLNQDAKNSPVFNRDGPVVYAASFMDAATSMIDQGKPEEAKQAIHRARWVLFEFVMGDDE